MVDSKCKKAQSSKSKGQRITWTGGQAINEEATNVIEKRG
jgi:hypothetical protein